VAFGWIDGFLQWRLDISDPQTQILLSTEVEKEDDKKEGENTIV
jgi:hypothetical protein